MIKVKDVPIPMLFDGHRDAGKVIRITEMPALQAERWAIRAFIALKGTAGSIPHNYADLGMVGVAILGLNAFFAADVDYEKLAPLLDEMMTCAKMVRDPSHPEAATAILPSDLLDYQTITWLRGEIIGLHTNFSLNGALWELIAGIRATLASQNTETSRPSSDTSSE